MTVQQPMQGSELALMGRGFLKLGLEQAKAVVEASKEKINKAREAREARELVRKLTPEQAEALLLAKIAEEQYPTTGIRLGKTGKTGSVWCGGGVWW